MQWLAIAVTQPASTFSRLTSWVATHLAATATTLVGIVAYSVLRVSYATFYGRFDVEPEEVGLGQTEIITHTILGLIALVLLVGAFMGFEFMALKALGGIRPVRVPDTGPLWRRALAFTTTPYWIILLPTLFTLALFVLFALPERAGSLADQVQKGETVRPPVSWHLLDLHVKALPVTLKSLGSDPLAAQLRSPSLRYLGEAGGLLVLYDWRAKKVIRLPAGSVMVLTSN